MKIQRHFGVSINPGNPKTEPDYTLASVIDVVSYDDDLSGHTGLTGLHTESSQN